MTTSPELSALMSARHDAYQAAKAEHFENESLNHLWREANRAYVLGRVRPEARLNGSVSRIGARTRVQAA